MPDVQVRVIFATNSYKHNRKTAEQPCLKDVEVRIMFLLVRKNG